MLSQTKGFRKPPTTLSELRHVGKATLADLKILGITRIDQLAECEAETLYVKLQKKTQRHHDPCVWDVFAAAIHESRTGEPLDWWKFTAKRKEIIRLRLKGLKLSA